MIQVRGLVQGVGFRPFIYRLADRHSILGWVENRSDGVMIHAEGKPEALHHFLAAIQQEAPQAAGIRSVKSAAVSPGHFTTFRIRKSRESVDGITEISPDIAVCDACLEDMKRQPHRLAYPFINCTNCGPRFTIIYDLPYDREKTTMKVFPMCEKCREEYEQVLDRRFHAQPVACNHCGPHYTLETKKGSITRTEDILLEADRMLGEGKILAIKGMGGFHLTCDALNETSTKTLRQRKNREGKPFAVMFKDLASIERFLVTGERERNVLTSWHRPIVILKNKLPGEKLAFSVSNGFDTTGAMLPYMPFHHQLFEILHTPVLVLTSGNLSDEPILISNEKAREELMAVANGIITYNRDILNRTDDSVVMVINDRRRMIRRSRGFVPLPVETAHVTEGIFAAGAELVNCFGIGKGKQALLSQHIGDLKNLETLEFYAEAIQRFRTMFRFQAEVLAVDLHPDYLSRKYCMEVMAKDNRVAVTEIQHHHAHIASCMAEHRLDEKVIGVSLDGVGYGTDGNIWGFEFLVCDLVEFERRLHAEYVPQPGGDLATREPWRMAMAYLYKVYGNSAMDLALPFYQKIPAGHREFIMEAISKGINAPLTCSAGRLFDAVAAITGVCTHSAFHAEAPMRLEQVMANGMAEPYPFHADRTIHTGDLIRGVTEDVLRGEDPSVISLKFHLSIIEIVKKGCLNIRRETGIKKVVMSGGTFQNRFLLSTLENRLQEAGLQVYTQQEAPSNDGGIALGQLAIAAKRRSAGMI